MSENRWRHANERPAQHCFAVFGVVPECTPHDIRRDYVFLVKPDGAGGWLFVDGPLALTQARVTRWREIEYPVGPKEFPAHVCPTCGGEPQLRCRCILADSMCSQGHHWHVCPVHHLVVVGEADHTAGDTMRCTCKEASK